LINFAEKHTMFILFLLHIIRCVCFVFFYE